MTRAEDVAGPEWADWYRLTPRQRFEESAKLWQPSWRSEDRLIPNPIRRVLSSIEQKRVRALLMGGQACVLYGAAEFSRDTDLAILASPANLARASRPRSTTSRPA